MTCKLFDLPGNGKTIMREKRQRRGYADHPGTGPAGETCKTCKHLARVQLARDYLKCGLMKSRWGCVNTDVLASAPACSKWEKRDGAV